MCVTDKTYKSFTRNSDFGIAFDYLQYFYTKDFRLLEFKFSNIIEKTAINI